jgi:hypothetical protein
MPKQQWEEQAKDRFIAALKASGRGDWTVSDRDVVVDAATNRNFDYQLSSADSHIALEVFRLVENEEELANEKLWSTVANQIAAELRKRGIKGYTILTPRFDVSRNKIPAFVQTTADQLALAITQNPEQDIIKVDGFEIKRLADFADVSLYDIGPGGAVNPSGTAYAALSRKLPKKNTQLEIAGHERIIFIVNWAYIVALPDMIEACSQLDFSQFQNIDKIVFEAAPENIHVVYDRAVYEALQSEGKIPTKLDPLFVEWLGNRLVRMDASAFRHVQEITEREKSLLWLPAMSREQLVRYGEQFLKEKAWADLHWVVDALKDDPDPSTNNATDDRAGEFNDHLRVKRGERADFIRSVRGRLCWLLQQMVGAARTEDLEYIFEITQHYATAEHLYVRRQATVPLMELAKRRYVTIAGTDTRFMSDEFAGRVKALALRMVEENLPYPTLLEGIVDVIVFVKDLDEETAFAVIQKLLTIQSSEAARKISLLSIYFALFRERHYLKLGKFNADRLRSLLSENLRRGTEWFRANAADHFKKMLQRREVEFGMLEPWLQDLISGPSDRIVNMHFYELAANAASTNQEQVCRLVEIAVQKEIEKLKTDSREVWHPKQFSEALNRLAQAGPEYEARTAQIRQSLLTQRDRIFDVHL